MRPRLLDLFCGAGGAAMGYARAGFDVVGVDIAPQPHYPFEFVQADALKLLDDLMQDKPMVIFTGRGGHDIRQIDAIHASLPCQDHSMSTNYWNKEQRHGTGWMLAATRERLAASGIPWVIENVPGAPMRTDYLLCGCMFGLPGLKRERWFETSWRGFDLRPPCHHTQPSIPICGHGVTSWWRKRHGKVSMQARRDAMGIDWMTRDELSQAIPPAYTEHIGRALLEHLTTTAGGHMTA